MKAINLMISSTCSFVFIVFYNVSVLAQPTVPSDPELIAEAKNMLHFFDTVYQKKIIGAMRGPDQALTVKKLTGEYPAVVEQDLTGWDKKAWSYSYKSRVQAHIYDIKNIWYDKKAIPGMCWHWGNPLTGGGTYTASKEGLTVEEFNNIVTPGTEEHNIMMEDLKKHADYLQQLADENIPLIWRPLHEIDGGWFWWTDKNNPENTVKLWKIMYNYLVKEREMHNLIWVYSAGVGNPTKKDMEYRKSFYPGDEWCDMIGIDLYGWDFRNTGIHEFWNATQSYQEAFDVMKELAPDKLIILTETDAMPNIEKTFQGHANFAKWLWAMPWWAGDSNNPNEWIKQTYTHENVIMQPDLPDFTEDKTTSSGSGKPVVEKKISMYTIPGSDYITINPSDTYDVWVHGVHGRMIKHLRAVSGIETYGLKKGIYVLKIKNNTSSFIQKFIKE